LRLLLVLAAAVQIACTADEQTPVDLQGPVREGATRVGVDSNALEEQLTAILARYEPPSWRCSQYLFDMQDLAAGAHRHVPEVAAMVESGVHPDEVGFMLQLMGSRASVMEPALEDLARHQDSAVRARAQAALETIRRGAVAVAKAREPGTGGHRTTR
jgi:hypothetical protein